jgi:hypothetical protein
VARLAIAIAFVCLAACATAAGADWLSDAPDPRHAAPAAFQDARSYDDALQVWRGAEDVNTWIGARFEYDRSRAMLLSETQRSQSGRVSIHRPDAFFAAPTGVCVDLARFAVETLRAVEPQAKPAYVMIEFAPVAVAGNILRRHWLVSFERDGKRYFFADSKRPGHIAGPYASTRDFMEEYARYRGREVVAFRELESYERKARTLATKQPR